jgi:hypothetical protein
MQMAIARGLLFHRAAQEPQNRRCSVDIQANRHAVDEQPGDIFRVGQFGRTSGHGQTKDDVRLARQGAQQDRPRDLNRDAHGQVPVRA